VNRVNTEQYNTKEEYTFKDVTSILRRYKWSIFFITILSATLSATFLYFKPSIYESYAIIKVKPNIKTTSEDLINNTVSTTKSKDVTEEISLLKTFNVNNPPLNKVYFGVQYFIEKNYKIVELYRKIPIDIKNIEILNSDILGRRLTLIPHKNGYSIQYINSYKEQIQHKLFHKKLFKFDSDTIFPYNKQIRHKYFTLFIEKKSSFNQPIHFIIQGTNRDIFEKIIKNNLSIRQLEKDTSLIKISYTDTIAARAQLYVNALTDSFIAHSINNKNKQNDKTLKFILKELKEIKDELSTSEQQLEAYQVSRSIVKPSVQATFFIKKLSDIEIQLSENNLKKKLIVNLINFVENNYNLETIAPSLSKLSDENTLRLIRKLQDNQLLEEELSVDYTNEYPKLKSLRKQIQNIRGKIAFNFKSLETNIEYQNSNLIERKTRYENDLKKLPSQQRHLVNIKRNYEVKSRMYEYLLKKEAENKIIQFATFSDYQIIDHAYTSKEPIKNKKSLILILSIILGFILASLLAFIRNYFNRDIQSQQDIEKLTTLPIYGSIPFQKQKKHELKVNTDDKSPFTESFRTLRTNLQFIKKEGITTTILITSTIASEGKTTISANLAAILAKAHYNTLLINLDIRKPTLHKFFSLNNDAGITNYLNGQCSIEDIISKTEFGNLDIITSGPIPQNPSELILSKKLSSLLENLKTKYDYIIIDTAPIGIVTDTKNLMQYSDLNLMILKEDYAKKEFIVTLEQMIEKHNFKNIGLLLNGSKETGGEYGYGYSYEYGE